MADQKRTAHLAWDDLRFFVALAEAGSLSATARSLRVTHATVGRRIAHLEAAVGRMLFDRRADGYVLTADGQNLLDDGRAMQAAALSILNRLDAGETSTGPILTGSVRVTTTHGIADNFLAGRLGALTRTHPDLDIELLADWRVASLPRREAEIAIRLGRPRDGSIVGRRLGSIAFGFYAIAHPPTADPARTLPLIGYEVDNDIVPEAQWMAAQFPSARFRFRSNSQMAQAEAARAGLGVVLLPRYMMNRYPDLVPYNIEPSSPARELWLLVRSDLVRVPRVRVVLDYLVGLFKSDWNCPAF